MEFWNSQLTEKSWQILQELKKKYRFTLIGGWATYLWTKQQKSQDIDIVVEIKELEKFKQENLTKNDRLKKYELKRDEIDIDIYVPYFSRLSLPTEELVKHTEMVEGFEVVSREALIILKQGALLDRKDSVKGEKDRVDIMSISLLTNVDWHKYDEIVKKFSIETYKDNLAAMLRGFTDYSSLNLSPRELKLKKLKVTEILKKLK